MEIKMESSGILEEDLIELMKKIANLGLPFYKNRKGSKAYDLSLKKLSMVYRKYGGETFKSFELASEYFNKYSFPFKPKKISIASFITFTQKELMNNPPARSFSNEYKVKSCFSEFIKGRRYIEAKYIKKTILEGKVDLLTKKHVERLKLIWREYKGNIGEEEIYYRFINNAKKFNEKNSNIGISDIFYLLEKEILSNIRYNINNPKTLNSNYFWNLLLPDVLVLFGIYKSKHYIKEIEV